MNKIKKTILLFCLCFVVTSAAFSEQVFDGNFWDGLTDVGKAVFIFGMVQGESNVIYVLSTLGEDLIAKTAFDKVVDKRGVEEIIQDIDYFYSSIPERKKLPIGYAYLVTLNLSKRK